MDVTEVRDIALRALGNLAPEADLGTIAGDQLLQEVLDLDSFDFLQLVQAVHDATGVDIPEIDYPKVATLDGLAAYVGARSG